MQGREWSAKGHQEALETKIANTRSIHDGLDRDSTRINVSASGAAGAGIGSFHRVDTTGVFAKSHTKGDVPPVIMGAAVFLWSDFGVGSRIITAHLGIF